MPIDLREYERGAPFNGDAAAELASLQDRIARLNLAQIVHGKRLLVIFEGWSGSGRKAALKALASGFDPCELRVSHFRREDIAHDQRHWFAPFWEILPSAGETRLCLGSWYSRALDLKQAGRVDDKLWTRMLDEINEFESQQRDHGTILVKLFFHVSGAVQRQRLEARLADPWQRHRVDEGEMRRLEQRDVYQPLISEIFDSSNMRWAPWNVVDAGDLASAQIATLGHVAEALNQSVPSQPPSDAPMAQIVDFQARRRG